MKIVDYPDRDMAAFHVADVLAGDLENALLRHDRVTLAVPGGTTPGPVFDVLCAADLDWARITVLPTDERFVPDDHDRSNARLIRQRLLTGRAAAAGFLPLTGGAPSPAHAAKAQSAALLPHLPLSVLLLGMGADMHTASLFPGAHGLTQALGPDDGPVCVLRPDSQPEARLSLNARALDGALSKHLLIYGDDKRAALERAQSLPPEAAPIRAVLREMTVHWAP